MRATVVRYRVKPGRADENEALVRAVYDELARSEPDGLRYATFRLDDGLTFVHVAVEDEPGSSPLPGLAAFEAFQAELPERCDEPPAVSRAAEVGLVRLFG